MDKSDKLEVLKDFLEAQEAKQARDNGLLSQEESEEFLKSILKNDG